MARTVVVSVVSFSTWWAIMGQQTTPCLLISLVARLGC